MFHSATITNTDSEYIASTLGRISLYIKNDLVGAWMTQSDKLQLQHRT